MLLALVIGTHICGWHTQCAGMSSTHGQSNPQ